MAEAVEDLFSAIANDFAKPNTAVHGDEQCAIAQARRLGVGYDIWIQQIVPDFDDLGFAAAAVEAEFRTDLGEKFAGGFDARVPGLFQRRQIDAAPLSDHALARGDLAGAKGWKGAGHGLSEGLNELNE